MRLSESARIARKSLLANRIRSLLSVLGLVIGIAAATLVAAIGNGMRLSVMESFDAMGVRALTVLVSSAGRPGILDEEALGRVARLSFVEAAFPSVNFSADGRGALAEGSLNAAGVHSRYLDVYHIPLLEGRGISDEDAVRYNRVCLLSADAARRLYGGAPAIGQALRFGRATYDVVGLVGPSARPVMGKGNRDLYIPLATLTRQEDLGKLSQSAEVWVKKDHAGDPKDDILLALAGEPSRKAMFMVLDPKALAEEAQNTSRRLQLAMMALASVSLLVGGIGIMNVMLISVIERTREVGLRKALGASERDILTQFLVEVVVLSGAGGVGGVALGMASAWLVPVLARQDLPTAVDPLAVCLALTFSVLVGAIFGLYPAVKASRLPPLEALRYE